MGILARVSGFEPKKLKKKTWRKGGKKFHVFFWAKPDKISPFKWERGRGKEGAIARTNGRIEKEVHVIGQAQLLNHQFCFLGTWGFLQKNKKRPGGWGFWVQRQSGGPEGRGKEESFSFEWEGKRGATARENG